MAIHGGTHFVISANFTDSGAPAYLAANGEWVREFQRSAPIETESERDALLNRALEQERLVCDPYFFDVRLEGGVIDPISARERIRAEGPTVRIRRPDTSGQERSQEHSRESASEMAEESA
jgi:hypothetical protein